MCEVLVGIDFGTTNTVITYFSDNKTHILMDSIFKIIPSKIGKINNKTYCGNYIPINCENIIHSFKLLDNNFEYLIIFFKHIYDLINNKLNCNNIKAVITVPSNFNDKQRETIKSAFIAVGFTILRIINEPSAAALAYGLIHSSNDEEKILVIDTGGGTMDFTILEKNEGFFEVLHSDGLNDLGGNNFTKLIMDDIIRVNSLNVDEINEIILWNQSQRIKEKLTYLDTFEIKIKNLFNSEKIIDYILTKTKFENLTNGLIQKVENILTNIIKQYQNINYIILVGGTSRIPILQKTIQKITQKKPWIHPNLESVVAEGAGLYAGIIENKFTINNDVVLMDVLPLSLGVELADGSYSIIIPKNTPLPIKRSHKYTTDSPCESSINVKIYQGERKIANKNFLIGEFIFDKVSMGGMPIIEISFKVDLNSIITVTVIDRKSGHEKNIIIKDIPKIEIEEINKIIENANSLSEIDQNELQKSQNIYLIKVHIENSLINLQVNDLMSKENKKELIDKFYDIENKLEEMNNLELINTLKDLQDNHSILGSATKEESNDNKMNDIEKLFLEDRKSELKNRIILLLVKNPDWNEYLEPVLEELSYNTTTIDYVNDKFNLLNELENDNEIPKDYKQEVNNLCLYIKNELEAGNINLNPEKNIILKNIIDDLLSQLSSSNNDTIDWEEQLNILNDKCEQIYSNN